MTPQQTTAKIGKLFLCKTCQRRFLGIKTLTNHELKHLKFYKDESPYCCQHCPLRFELKNSLIEHLSTHTEEKPHVCEICNVQFLEYRTWFPHLGKH